MSKPKINTKGKILRFAQDDSAGGCSFASLRIKMQRSLTFGKKLDAA
jgi:hypothetical protein